jgi:hypothetical protein
MDIGSKEMHSQAIDINLCFGYNNAEERRNSDAKDTERSRVCEGRGRRAAIHTPCSCGIGSQELVRGTKDDDAAPDCRHLRNNLPRSRETFSRDTIRPARLRHQHRNHSLNTRVIHGRVSVNHSRHRVRRRNAVSLPFRAKCRWHINAQRPVGMTIPASSTVSSMIEVAVLDITFGNRTSECITCANSPKGFPPLNSDLAPDCRRCSGLFPKALAGICIRATSIAETLDASYPKKFRSPVPNASLCARALAAQSRFPPPRPYARSHSQHFVEHSSAATDETVFADMPVPL